MSTSAPSPAGSRVYHIVLFSFAGAKRAGDVLQEINAAQKLADDQDRRRGLGGA